MVVKTALAAVMAVMAVSTAPAAEARPTVCSSLDANPTLSGLEDVLGILQSSDGNGMSPYDAGSFARSEIDNYCPRHLPLVDDYVAKWAPKTYV